MGKIILMDNENKKYKMFKDFVEKGLKNKDRLCVSLNLSIRQVSRLIEKYKEKGKAGFIHGNRERKPRAKYIGELIQKDASEYIFFGSKKSTLYLAIDDASGQIVGATFDKQETLRGYYLTFEMILKNHGISACFLTDNRTVFNYESKKMSPEHDTRTHFAYACEQLGVEIRTTSVAQKKGRVERLNQLLQDRLTSELMRAEIQTMDEAQKFLAEFIKRYNNQFALDTKNLD